jgi:hypothetical protein
MNKSNSIGVRAIAGALAIGAIAVGAYGIWIVRSQMYTHGPDMRIVRTVVMVAGQEAVVWGWTLIFGSLAAVAWSVLIALPTSARSRTVHVALAGIALAAVIGVCVLQEPSLTGVSEDARANAFYSSLGMWVLSALTLLLLSKWGVAPLATVLTTGSASVLVLWGFDGLTACSHPCGH